MIRCMTGEDVRAWRTSRKLTQQQFAELLGVSRQSVYQWETGGYLPAGRLLELALHALACQQVDSRPGDRETLQVIQDPESS